MLSLLLAGLLALPPAYSAVVVDATTNRPLAGVSIRPAALPAQGTTTDAQGLFTLASQPQALDLSLVGYAPLHLAVPTQHQGIDTLRLLPQAYALADVHVRPPKAVTISSIPEKGHDFGELILPGISVGLLIPRPATVPADQPCLITEVRLRLRDRPREGRLRIRLVPLATNANGTNRPGIGDLLPTPFIVSLPEMAASKGGEIKLDFTPYNIVLPASGLCVVVESLLTDPADQVLRTEVDAKKNILVLLAPRPGESGPARVLRGSDFPYLLARQGTGLRTWMRSDIRPEWNSRQALFFAVHAQVSLLTY